MSIMGSHVGQNNLKNWQRLQTWRGLQKLILTSKIDIGVKNFARTTKTNYDFKKMTLTTSFKLLVSLGLFCLVMLALLCWFQTNLPLAALPLWWWYLFNCASATCRRGRPSGKQRQPNRSITLPLCPPRQIADSWILFNSGAFAARWKAKAALPLRAATLKQQAMITRRSGKAASGKLVWNQHYFHFLNHRQTKDYVRNCNWETEIGHIDYRINFEKRNTV